MESLSATVMKTIVKVVFRVGFTLHIEWKAELDTDIQKAHSKNLSYAVICKQHHLDQ